MRTAVEIEKNRSLACLLPVVVSLFGFAGGSIATIVAKDPHGVLLTGIISLLALGARLVWRHKKQ